MIRATFIAVLLGIIVFFVYLGFYTGYYRSVEIAETKAPAFILLSKDHLGPYHKIVPVIEEVETWAKSKGIDCSKSFGLYIDDPKVAEEIRLKSKGGCILNKRLTADLISQLPQGFTESLFPEDGSEGDYVKAVFDGAPGIGPLKVYPAVLNFIEEKRLPFVGWNVLEVYETNTGKSGNAMTTSYYFPLLSSEPMPE